MLGVGGFGKFAAALQSVIGYSIGYNSNAGRKF